VPAVADAELFLQAAASVAAEAVAAGAEAASVAAEAEAAGAVDDAPTWR
jgi:hypothetical protein